MWGDKMIKTIDFLYEQMKYLDERSLVRVSLYLDYLYQEEGKRKRGELAEDCQAFLE